MCHRRRIVDSRRSYLGLFLGVDHFKAILLDSQLKQTFTSVVKYDVDLPEYRSTDESEKESNAVESDVNPVIYVNALDIVLNCLQSQGADLNSVAAISGSAYHNGAVYWTELGFRRICGLNPLRRLHEHITDNCFIISPRPTALRRSAVSQCMKLEEEVGGEEEMCKITGSICFGALIGPQICKFHEDTPDLYQRAVRISLMSTLLSSLLVGTVGSIDLSSASGMNLLDIQSRNWSKQCLKACAPSLKSRLREPISSNRLQGRVSSYYVHRWNFRPDCMVVSSIDSTSSMLAAINLQKDSLILSLSNIDKVIIVIGQYTKLEDGFLLYHPTNINEYVAAMIFRNGSKARKAVCKELADRDWNVFDKMLSSTPMGNNGNLLIRFDEIEFFPEVSGTLRWDRHTDESSSHALQGVSQFSDPKVEARAFVEGQVMHRLMLVKRTGFAFQPSSRIILTGDYQQIPALCQIIADIFNVPVYVQKEGPEPALLGAAYRACYAYYEYREANCDCQVCRTQSSRRAKLTYDQFFDSVGQQLKVAAKPTPGSQAIYKPLFNRYTTMYRVLASSQENTS